MKKLTGFIIMMSFILSLGLPLVTQAQDGGELTDDELALLERMLGAEDLLDSYSGYGMNRWDSEISTITYNDEENYNNIWLRRYGYALNEGEMTNASYHAFFSDDTETGYAIEGDVIWLDEIAYVNAGYVTGSENDAPIAEGWQVMETEEDIPPVLLDLGLDQLFDDETLFDKPEILIMYASSVTSEEVTITGDDEEFVVEQIQLVIDGDNFLPFYLSTFEEDAPAHPVIQVLFSEGLTGSMSIIVQFDENGDVYMISASISAEHADVDAYAVNSEVFNEGDTLGLTLGFYVESIYSDINGEFEPIEAPALD